MKKIYLYAMALGLMFASCEDFLTEYPKNKITPDDFFIRGVKRNAIN